MFPVSHNRRVSLRPVLLVVLWGASLLSAWWAMPVSEAEICQPGNGHSGLTVAAGAAVALATYPSLWRSWSVLQRLAMSLVAGALVAAAIFGLSLGSWIHNCAN
jgi:hypothetical protein